MLVQQILATFVPSGCHWCRESLNTGWPSWHRIMQCCMKRSKFLTSSDEVIKAMEVMDATLRDSHCPNNTSNRDIVCKYCSVHRFLSERTLRMGGKLWTHLQVCRAVCLDFIFKYYTFSKKTFIIISIITVWKAIRKSGCVQTCSKTILCHRIFGDVASLGQALFFVTTSSRSECCNHTHTHTSLLLYVCFLCSSPLNTLSFMWPIFVESYCSSILKFRENILQKIELYVFFLMWSVNSSHC